ncbi:glycosyltransferase family 4 protein [Pseudomonadota bacterium]
MGSKSFKILTVYKLKTLTILDPKINSESQNDQQDMKILNLLYKQNTGGVGQCFIDYGNALIKNGNEVSIIISEKNRLNADYSIFQNVYKLKNHAPILDSLKILLIENKQKPDFIICHDPRSIRLACNIKLLIRAKVIGINHGWGYKQSLRADYIFNVNEPIRQKTIESGFDKNKTFVVSNMIEMEDSEKFLPQKFHKPIIIGALGRIERDKGFDILVETAKLLKKQKIDFKVKIGGFVAEDKGEFFKTLKCTISSYNLKNEIEFVGQVTNKKKFYDSIDILVVPSRHESFGMVILEGFKYSKPIISSNTDGAKILIKDNKNGLIFNTEDAKMLAEQLKFLIKNQKIAEKIAKSGFEDAKKKYSMEIVGREINKKLINFSQTN